MSADAMQNEARIESLRCLSYSEREAAFLCLAALHGGYFLRRQYVEFLGKSRRTVAALIDRAFTLRHERRLPSRTTPMSIT